MSESMLWRVRATLPDRPGALAVLARRCGAAGVNIVGLQIFPGVEDVTDELVLATAQGWEPERVAALVSGSGCSGVVVLPSSKAALADQPTRYVRAAQTILERPMSFPDVLSRLFDTAPDPSGPDAEADVMTLTVGEVEVQVRRPTPFTATEHARGAALADLVSDVLRRSREAAAAGTTVTPEPGSPAVPEYAVAGDTVVALLAGTPVGVGELLDPTGDDDGKHDKAGENGKDGEEGQDGSVRAISLRVDPAWRRRGIGTRLLLDTARLAQQQGAAEVVLRTTSQDPAVLPLVLAAGLRARIRMSGDLLTLRIPVHALRPLAR